MFGELQDMQLERLLVEGLKCQVKSWDCSVCNVSFGTDPILSMLWED